MDRLLQLEVFSRTAELGSLSKAAELLRMSNAAASRHLSALEERLAVRLIERNTRRQWLTEAGQELLQRCSTLLNELAEAEDAVSDRALSPKGMLRVTSSLSFAMIYMAPMLPAFRRLYPKLDVQIIAANRYPDFIEAGIDVAIRTREQEPDSNIIIRRIGQMRRVLAAAPSYLAARGIPEHPADLARHDMLVYNLANDPYSLRLSKGSTTQTVRIAPTLDSNDGQIICGAARAGLGILIQPLYIVQGDIKAGKLVPVLTDWELPLLTMNVAYQNRVRLPAKIRVFSDFLVEHIRAHSDAGIWIEAT
ncbi:LysR family transcriptional regulator [Bradyrhizobium guangdongense]|uniref:Transcriptional regulator n=1 Tax=Bradyrhizobium guangdongense TaxID=1325090 RepID=A0A410V7M9_9BRAD|nr:LysR family transcriptional regulator [Bradyrhizobium guangdongense]QAU39668.1 LysR family transcriptional regulator [Bradyrhizobium guangdongense]QOZ60732.1 LysR family transcriptional regulator [Bradyrhizobium guangdongense]GGI24319.1 transcriptional regulator [Bradyrhizobium guangdongense]